MLISFVTDLHVQDQRLDGDHGHAALLTTTVQQIREAGCDLVLIGGDLAGVSVPHKATIRERNALVQFVLALAEIAPVVICRGNHDTVGDYAFLGHLAGVQPIFFVEDGPELIDTGNAAVMVLPWLDRGRVVGPDQDYGQVVREIYAGALADCADDLRSARSAGQPAIVLTHAAMPDAMIRDGQPIVPTADPVIALDALLADVEVDAVFVGHYHLHQRVAGPVPAWYGGSLFCNDHGENPDKGWLLYNSDTRSADLRLVDQPWRLTIRIDDGIIQAVDPAGGCDEIVGRSVAEAEDILRTLQIPAHVRIEAKVTEARLTEQTVAIARLRAELVAGALSVKVEVSPQRTLRVRDGAVDLANAETIPAKVKQFAGQLAPRPAAPVLKRSLQLLDDMIASEA